MRWYKHMTNSHNDEKLVEILHELGLEGYGFWWLLLEIIGKEMDSTDRCELSYPLKAWARKLHCSPRKTTAFFTIFSEKNLVFLEFDNTNGIGKLKIRIPNLLKYRDEYSKKSGHAPDKLPTDSGAKIEIEKKIEKQKKEKDKKEKQTPLFAADDLPGFIPHDLWQDFMAMRKTIKKPATDRSKDLLIKKLTNFHSRGIDVAEVLQRSIVNCWQDVFEPKNMKTNGGISDAFKKDFLGGD